MRFHHAFSSCSVVRIGAGEDAEVDRDPPSARVTVCDGIGENPDAGRDQMPITMKSPVTHKSLPGFTFTQTGDYKMFPTDSGR